MQLKQFEKYTCLNSENRGYVEELTRLAGEDPWRPDYHICPPCGLSNDPNGLAYFGGNYHVFYQWHPFGPSHGMKHWAHVVSKDLKKWQWDENMLIPDQEYEKNGCYSGNAIEKEGKLYLFYTANYKTENGRIPKQALAVMDADGRIAKCPANPIIDGAPEGMAGDIRDPFVFRRDGQYWMLLGAADQAGAGQLLAYAGEDLYHWEYRGSIAVDGIPLGTMVECPGIIHVDGRDVLLLSLIGIKPESMRFRNRCSTVYAVGTLDLENMRFCTENWDELDGGFDYYAPQAFYGKDGVPLIFAWFGCGDQKLPSDAYQWRHGLTMPRILRVEDGRLASLPAPEAAGLYREISEKEAAGGCRDPFVVRIDIEAMDDEKVAEEREKASSVRTITLGPDGDQVVIRIDRRTRRLTVDRSHLKLLVDSELGMERSVIVPGDGPVHVDIYADHSFFEVYVNGGIKTLSFRAFPCVEPV